MALDILFKTEKFNMIYIPSKMPPKKRTRAQSQEEQKSLALDFDNLYAVFGYNNDQVYIPFKSCQIYVTIMQNNTPTLIISSVMNATLGIKRISYSVYSNLNKLSVYRTEKPNSDQKAISFASTTFTNDEKKFAMPLNMCWISAPYFDGQRFICKTDQLVLTVKPGDKTFMFKDCFFHEEFSSLTCMVLKKNKQVEIPDQVHEIERSQPNEPAHMGMYS
jgi:hypothetical protein